MIGGDDDGLGHRGSTANTTRAILPDVAVACHRATIHRVIAFMSRNICRHQSGCRGGSPL
jgi:hypothetical protein